VFSSACRRGILALSASAGGSGFSPATAFSGGRKGLWWDQSDIASSYQDSAATTPLSATGQPVGKGNDKSGNANHFIEATSAARPIYTVAGAISSWVHDGVDDGGSTAVVSAGTFTSTMDLFITLKRASTAQMVIASQAPTDGARILGVIDGSAGGAFAGCGAAFTCFVDGVAVGTVGSCTRVALGTALGSGAQHVLEVRDLDLSLWTQFTLSLYSSFMLAADVAQLILCESQSSLRSSLRTFAGAKGGLTL
jgi:hypothetical protein